MNPSPLPVRDSTRVRVTRPLAAPRLLCWLGLGLIAPNVAAGSDGRLIGGECFAVCASAETDPDENGVVDGWGYENAASCVVPGSSFEQDSPVCEALGLGPIDVEPAIPAGPVARPDGNLTSGFFVSDGRLFDRLGNDFVMRGVNHALVWHQTEALEWLDQIALSGANTVRLVWETGAPAAVLEAAIARCVALHMVPMVELHDITGGTDAGQPLLMANYYIDELSAVLLEFEDDLLINVANEWSGDDAIYTASYLAAVLALREHGVHHTLVIDANGYGQRAETLLAQGSGLLEADPQHNLLFSVHMYQEFAPPQRILGTLQHAVLARLPLIVGEFGSLPVEAPGPIPYPVLLEEAQRLGIGYLAWVWTGYGSGPGSLDMSVDGDVDTLTDWGAAVIDGPFGIRATSQLASVFSPAPLDGGVPDGG